MEEFYSLQGEGYHTGEAAWFIRIGGCDVGCTWCDVKESWDADLFPPVETDKVVAKALKCPANAVVVTGGEPLLYNLDYLCEQLQVQNSATPQSSFSARGRFKVQEITPPQPSPEGEGVSPLQGVWGHHRTSNIVNRTSKIVTTFLETSGSQPLSGSWNWICLSPKRDWPPREEFYTISHELKVIIHEEEDFGWAEEQADRMNPHAHLFLQPEWSLREIMLPNIIRYIESNPAWKLSLQMHKYIGIP